MARKWVLVQSLDRKHQEHPEWFENLMFQDLPTAYSDIQRRVALGSDLILITVLHLDRVVKSKGGEKAK